MSRSVPRRFQGFALITVVLFALVPAGAGAAIPGPGGVISACYLAGTGHVRIIDSGAACLPVETSIQWQQSGQSTDLVCTLPCVDSAEIVNGQVQSTDLGDGSVLTAKLADAAVTGPKIANSQVGLGHLAFDPATQVELNALAAPGTINTATNPVHWSKLLGVPAGIADGTDADSGGDITGITTAAGSGLTGGATNGDVGLSLLACSDGQILKRSAASWVCGTDLAGGSNADTLDSLDSAAFLRSDAADSFTGGTLTVAAGNTLDVDGALRIDGQTSLADGTILGVLGNVADLTVGGADLQLRLGDSTDDDVKVPGSLSLQNTLFMTGGAGAAAEGNQTICFFEAAVSCGESIKWDNAFNDIELSHDTDIVGVLDVFGNINVTGPGTTITAPTLSGTTVQATNVQGTNVKGNTVTVNTDGKLCFTLPPGNSCEAYAQFDSTAFIPELHLECDLAGFDCPIIFDTDVSARSVDLTGNLTLTGAIQSMSFPSGATTNGVCHSGADSDTFAEDRALVVCNNGAGDVAEWYETTGVSTGEVVVATPRTITYSSDRIDPRTGVTLAGREMLTSTVLTGAAAPYASGLMGVVSTSPVQTFGKAIIDAAKHPAPIAISGRVPVKVTTEGGAITPGDPITSSSVRGAGMKATGPGMIIGFALDHFSGEGVGSILVNVDLGWHGGPSSAAVSESRIAELEMQNADLSSRLDRLEALVARITGAAPAPRGVTATASVAHVEDRIDMRVVRGLVR